MSNFYNSDVYNNGGSSGGSGEWEDISDECTFLTIGTVVTKKAFLNRTASLLQISYKFYNGQISNNEIKKLVQIPNNIKFISRFYHASIAMWRSGAWDIAGGTSQWPFMEMYNAKIPYDDVGYPTDDGEFLTNEIYARTNFEVRGAEISFTVPVKIE